MEEVKVQELSLRKRVIRGVFWFGATKTVGQAISWAITIYIARILSPGDYGLIGMSGIFTGFITMINELGLGAAIVQKKDLSKEDLSNIFWIVFSLNLSLYLLFVLVAPLIGAFFNEPRLVSIIRVSSLTFVISSAGYVSYWMLTKRIMFDKRSQIDFLANLSAGLSTLLLALKGYGVWSLVYGSIILELTKNVLLIIYYPWKPQVSFSFRKATPLLNFGTKITGSRIFWYIYSNSDFLIAGKVLGKTALGFYSLAFQLASMPLDKIISIITQVTLPAFSEVQENMEQLQRYFLKTVRIAAFVTFPLFMGLFLVADDAVRFFLTEKWSPLIIPLKVLCVVSTLRAINAINAPLVIAKGRPGIPMLNNLIYAAVLPVAFYIGSFYGLVGFSYAWLFAFPVVFVITTLISFNAVGLSMLIYLTELKHTVFGTIFMVAVVILSQKTFLISFGSIGKISMTCLIGSLSYISYHSVFNRDIFLEAKSMLRNE